MKEYQQTYPAKRRQSKWWEQPAPFFDGRVPSWDEITALVDKQVKERLEDEVWVNVRRHLISFRKLLYSGRKEVEPLTLRAVRVSTRKDHFYAKESKNRGVEAVDPTGSERLES